MTLDLYVNCLNGNVVYRDLSISYLSCVCIAYIYVGTLPASIGSLTAVVRMDMGTNKLQGNFNLKYKLYVKFIASAVGPLPPTIGLMTSVTYVNLYNNKING